tara:strand:+ start:439 stop:1158 length:720 start_codon:yes stop_codon:yes gene_type:complete
MSIWIPRTTSGFAESDGSIKIDGICYKAIQKNIGKDQSPSSETYSPEEHGALGEKYEDCPTCSNAQSTWAACFWLNGHCGDGYSIPGFGEFMGDFIEDGNWDYSDSAAEEYYSPGVTDFLTELVGRKDSLEKIVENPTSTSFSAEFNMPAPNNASSNYYEWQTSEDCIAAAAEGPVPATWTTFFLSPEGMYDTFQQNSSNLSVDATPAFDWNGQNYTITRIAQNQSSSVPVNTLSFSKA